MRLSVDSFAGVDSVTLSFTLLGMGEVGRW
jgi:hypothetical protein